MTRARALAAMVTTLIVLTVSPAAGQTSRCLAIADAAPPLRFAALGGDEVAVTFVGHATFRIESAGGVTIATDYAGYAGSGPVPDAVTMNRAHSTHYTDAPDPAIRHVLRGWNPEGGPAQHDLTIGDVKIRNVPTDIRDWSGGRVPDGNSIFIFEVAGLCIGHLGHLHHELGPEHAGWIGQLDIVMVPVDGSYTMALSSMIEVLKLLKARVVLPMHYFGPSTLARFIDGVRGNFAVDVRSTPDAVFSVAKLPDEPTVIVLPGN